jgi:hypothetical protein
MLIVTRTVTFSGDLTRPGGIKGTLARKVNEDGLQNEELTALLERMQALGIVKLGKLRARWLLHDKPYCPVGAAAHARLITQDDELLRTWN